MKENSIEEDIEILEQINPGVLYFAKDEDYEKYSKAIEHILSDYKRVLKENDQLKQDEKIIKEMAKYIEKHATVSIDNYATSAEEWERYFRRVTKLTK